MTAIAALAPSDPHRFRNAAEWLRSLGGVPLERVIFDPWPGTATEADLLRLVEGDRLCELIDGTLVKKPAGLIASAVAMNLAAGLGYFVKRNNLGVVSGADSTLRMAATGRIRLPDLCFFARARLPNGVLPPVPVPTLAPDLAVEVLSEGNTTAEFDQKLREYFQSGTRLAWVIDPVPRTVAVYHAPGEPVRVLNENDVLDGEQVVPGFTMPVGDLFSNIPSARSGG
ncbi:MAG: hypothetical protein AVDCRST_MAG64-804 [uncultured Phycisphaerae bacterium]|uniref:Putative restriction endonuclease domain-containing protein n=1 Tax=uncultured Phycisphaerae bacterium TaxID=904963 RepID=A0A6J4NFP6_9BACT|nr:MAG: hypothetical protein AVDCRST_MAG64-804 [uncultured Phycisphaerae bacterium]